MVIKSIAEVEAALLPYVPLVAMVKAGTALDRVWPLMELAGNPQDKLRVIHIAGTSGKTSTAYYMSALLTATGQKVGLTVSPHVDSITERVQINDQPLPEAEFCQALGEFLGIVRQSGQQPSYFELLYAFALWVFASHGVDYAVVETGMGGLLDATNVARRPDKVCVITDIGLDHTHVLGQTLTEITVQKAGIIYPGNQVFMYRQADEVMTIVQRRVAEQGAKLHVVEAAASDYQQRNWRLAYAAYQYLEARDDLQNLTSKVLQETQAIKVPARMEIKELNNRTLIMDGAHNVQKMAAFVASFRRRFPDTKAAIAISLKRDKERDYQALVSVLAPIASRVIATTFSTTQDLPVQSLDPQLIAQAFTDAGVPAESVPDQVEAIEKLLAGQENVCIVTGSFYLLGQLRNNGSI